MAIYELLKDTIRSIEETTFAKLGINERADLQRLLRIQIETISPGLLVIAEEFCEWEDSKRRIDLLALDKDANLVVIELKRTEDGGHMELQAIRYAAMVSAMTFERAVEVYAAYLQAIGSNLDPRHSILEFLEWEEANEDQFAQDVRIVLVSAEFSKELTTAVMWLNDRDLDIRCVRIKPYSDNGRVLIDVQQVIPLPEAAAYQVQLREKEKQVRKDRRGKTESDKLAQASPEIKQLYEQLQAELCGFGNDVQVIPLQYYIAFKRTGNFASVQVKSDGLDVFTKVDFTSVILEEGFSKDMRNIGHQGTGDLKLTVRSKDDLTKAVPLLKKSYEES
jgi:predicted transport protein